MRVITRLQLKDRGESRTILFGQPESEAELNEMFRLRFDVYSRRGYIDSARFPDGLEKDEYDTLGRSCYFTARIERGSLIGTIRLITGDTLPTEHDFEFLEPDCMGKIPRRGRGELGRLIVIPPSDGKYFPRNLVMLFLLNLLVEYGLSNGIEGGYVFVKKSLQRKLRKLRAPLHYIPRYVQRYPDNGVLYRYFHQANDPVVPAYFVTAEFQTFLKRLIHSRAMFDIPEPEKFILRPNLYNRFLRTLRII